jgi:hypothetical protein
MRSLIICTSNQMEKNEMGGACSTDEENRGVYKVCVGKPEEKRPVGRLGLRREDNIKINFQEVLIRGIDWFELAQDMDGWREVVNAVMNVRVP